MITLPCIINWVNFEFYFSVDNSKSLEGSIFMALSRILYVSWILMHANISQIQVHLKLLYHILKWQIPQRNWVFATNSNFLISLYLQPDGVKIWFFKSWLLDRTEFIVSNIKDLRHWIANTNTLKSYYWIEDKSGPINYLHYGNKVT